MSRIYRFNTTLLNDPNPRITDVSEQDFFNEDRGYGFVDYSMMEGKRKDRFLNVGGWQPWEGKCDESYRKKLIKTEAGIEVHNSAAPLCFRLNVEKGLYIVRVSIQGGKKGIQHLNIYTGRRNLVRRDVEIQAGECFEYQYYVRINEYIAVVGQPSRIDSAIYVSVTGTVSRISEIIVEKAEAPTLYICGDSIVTDYEGYYPYNPIINGGSWGQNLLQYFNGIAIDNHAHGGMTTNCFREDGHWNIIEKNIKPGDVVMLQFGHNDQKRRYLSAHGGYAANIRWYVQRIRSYGAMPIIVTSLSRIPNKAEHGWFDLLEEYAAVCRKIGHDLDVAVIDLHEYSFQLFSNMETERIKGYYNDTTHTNDYGALVMAEFIAKEIMNRNILPLAKCMNKEYPPVWQPDESLRPISSQSPIDTEEKPILPHDLPELPYVDCKDIPQLDYLKIAMNKGLLDPCLKYFHPFDSLPRGQFLYLFLKTINRPMNVGYAGKYCDIDRYEFDAGNVQLAIDLHLIDEETTPNDRFRPDDSLTYGELVSFIIRLFHPLEDRDQSLEQCEEEAEALKIINQDYVREQIVNRANIVVAIVKMLEIMNQR